MDNYQSICEHVYLNFFFLNSVFRNGDLLCPPFRFIIPRSMRQDLNQILGLVTEKVSLRTGAVRRLVTLSCSNNTRENEIQWTDLLL